MAADLTWGAQMVAADFVASQQRGSVAGTSTPRPAPPSGATGGGAPRSWAPFPPPASTQPLPPPAAPVRASS